MIVVAVLVILLILFWLLFSESLIELVQQKIQSAKNLKKRITNPPPCSDCIFYKELFLLDEDFCKCMHPNANLTFVEHERGSLGNCKKYGNNFEEKVC